MIANPFSLENRRVLVTGASSGIGRSIAIECSKMGASMIILGRNKERLDQTLSQLNGSDHSVYSLDLNDSIVLADFVDNLEYVDGLVHCAGIIMTCPAKYLNRKDLHEIFNTNLFASMELTKLLLEKKRLKKESSIVFISSVEGCIVASKGNGMYGASKGAVSAYAKVLALELSLRKIRVNSILPGIVRTKLLDKVSVSKEEFTADEKRYPLGYGKPNDVAWAAIYLLSDASRWMTGTNLLIDGGLTLQ